MRIGIISLAAFALVLPALEVRPAQAQAPTMVPLASPSAEQRRAIAPMRWEWTTPLAPPAAPPPPGKAKASAPGKLTANAPPANCSTAGGFPCVAVSWTGLACAVTVVLGTPAGTPPVQSETSGPCIAAILRCGGSVCGTATLPSYSGTSTALTVGTNVGTGNTWEVLTNNYAQTATASGTFYDNVGLAYSGLYNYVVMLQWTGSGGGEWSAFSNIFPITLPQAPAPTLKPAAPAAPTGVTSTPA